MKLWNGIVWGHAARLRPAALLLIGMLFLLQSAAALPLIWNIQTVDSAGTVGYFTSLALDADGWPHISYYDNNSDLKYAVWNGTSWAVAMVDSAGNVGGYTSLALDAAGRPRISYHDASNGDLKYAAWNGASWDLETVDSTGDVGWDTSLALDATGRPHISYYDFGNGNLKYAAWNGTTWDIQTVDSAGTVGWYTSLALDAAGSPRISYYDDSNRDLKYAAWNGTSWAVATVDSAGIVGYYTSLALDAAGRPRISYLDATNYHLKYAAWNGTTWDIQTVDSAGTVGEYTSLALNADDRPRISYLDATNYHLKYAARNGTTWDIQTVDSAGDVGGHTSLALDADGLPHISYYDFGNGNLKYAEGTSTNIYLSAKTAGTTGDGLSFGPEDILMWNGSSGDWSLWFDGSTVFPAPANPKAKSKHNINAFWIEDAAAGSFVASFAQNKTTVAGIIPKVEGTDLVRYDGSAFSLWFDGSDVGLDKKTAEKIDSLHVLDGGLSPIGGGCAAYLLVSTQGPGRVQQFGGGQLNFGGEDVLGFCLTNSGEDTAGFWHLAVDGSAEGLPRNATDSLSVSDDGQTIYLTTSKAVNIPGDGVSGGHSMVYAFDMTSHSFSGPHYSAPANGLPAQVDGLQVDGSLP